LKQKRSKIYQLLSLDQILIRVGNFAFVTWGGRNRGQADLSNAHPDFKASFDYFRIETGLA
jgi:hypothetical protein